jgi:hypothetical protein
MPPPEKGSAPNSTTDSRLVVFALYDGIRLLDLTGPLDGVVSLEAGEVGSIRRIVPRPSGRTRRRKRSQGEGQVRAQ